MPKGLDATERSRQVRWRAVLLAAAPLVILIGMVSQYGVDVPWTDQWALVPLLHKYMCGQLTFGDLWAQNNEHRLLFPRLVMLLLAGWSRWNIWYELITSLALAIAGFVTLAVATQETSRRAVSQPAGWEIAACSVLFFSLSQKENWFWGWQIQILLSQAVVISGFWILAIRPRTISSFIVAVLCGAVGMYSFANGLLYWPIGALLVLSDECDVRRLLRAVVWTACAAILILSYFFRYHTPDPSKSIAVALHRPASLLLYALIYLGGPVAEFHWLAAAIAGCLGCLLLASLIHRLSKRIGLHSTAFFWAISAYAIASGLMAAAGRLSLGLGSALASRYMAFSSLLWIAILCCAALCLRMKALESPGTKSLKIGCAAIVVMSAVIGLRGAQAVVSIDAPARRQARWAYLHDVNKTTEYLVPIVLVQKRLAVLKALHFSMFRNIEDSRSRALACPVPPEEDSQ